MKKTKAILGILTCSAVLSVGLLFSASQKPTAKIGWYATSEMGGSEGMQWGVSGAVGYVGGAAGAAATAWAGTQIGGTAGTFIAGPVGTVIGGAIGAGIGAF